MPSRSSEWIWSSERNRERDAQREALKGRLLSCRDPETYASFFSLADRRGRDEEDRIARAWALRQKLSAGR
jgi:hypothetical protein